MKYECHTVLHPLFLFVSTWKTQFSLKCKLKNELIFLGKPQGEPQFLILRWLTSMKHYLNCIFINNKEYWHGSVERLVTSESVLAFIRQALAEFRIYLNRKRNYFGKKKFEVRWRVSSDILLSFMKRNK